MTVNRKKVLLLLEAEILRQRAMAQVAAPELATGHLETAQALELALKLVKKCRFRRLKTKRKDENNENIRNREQKRRRG